ncbi:MAG: translation initiation factor IF-2 [Clostridiales bacterium]|jgi:translation initiation factor IF-2|nr:translation initiation factor IF-2 [Clostridiales bacterium]
MALAKVKTHELAKRLGQSSKELVNVLRTYGTKQRNNMSALEHSEIDIILDFFTQKFAVEQFDFLLKKLVDTDAENAQPEITEEEFLKALEEAQTPTQKVSRVVDTRNDTVDLTKFDTEKIDELVPSTIKDEDFSKKQKIIKKGQRKQEKTQTKAPEIKKEKPKHEHMDIQIPEEISVGEFAQLLKRPASDVVKALMQLGIMASISQIIDYDTAALIGLEFDAAVSPEIIVSEEELLFNDMEDSPEQLVPRSPVVVVMGHVDHGKTSLLDTIRNTNVISSEAGGITQHIGAYRVRIHDKKITFLDTPGHEAFTAMRARGAQATDIAILVVSADDGIMPQTIEAIDHAKAAEVHIIVAINKIDKEGANPDKVRQDLTEHGLVPEEWGGDTICVPVSAKKNTNIDQLLEMVALVADMKELKANPHRAAKGVIIEARLDKGKGPVATVLVQNGTLRIGDIIVAGTAVGRIRAMTNDLGKNVKSAAPSVPVEVLGFSETPEGGDIFYVVNDERRARNVVAQRKHRAKTDADKSNQQVATLDGLFTRIKEGQIKELNLIVKADVQGSVEAMCQSLEKLSNEEVRVRIVHGGVGAINDSDIMLAGASNAIIIGFNVRPTASASEASDRMKVEMRLYRVIYQAIEEVEAAMKGLLDPVYTESVSGHAEVRQIFKASSLGTIAGCYVTDGKLQRNSQARLIRDGIVLYEGTLTSLKRFKEDAKEVASGYECGLTLEKYNDIKEGDIIENFEMVEVAQ